MDVTQLPRAAGNIAFLFLIHVVVLPIAQSMRLSPGANDTRDTLKEVLVSPGASDSLQHSGHVGNVGGRVTCSGPTGFGRVAVVSYTLITVANAGFGGLCFLIFGDATAPNVLGNLGTGTGASVIRALLCVDLLFTIPMVLAAGREIIEGFLLSTKFGGLHQDLTITVARLAIVGVIFAVAAGISDFGDAVSLIGGLANALMGLILPPLFLAARNQAVLLVSLLGAILLVSSTYFTLHDMIVA